MNDYSRFTQMHGAMNSMYYTEDNHPDNSHRFIRIEGKYY
jgi:hypothetical protein